MNTHTACVRSLEAITALPETEYLYEASDGLAVSGHDVLLVRVHNAVALRAAKVILRQMQIDLITVKVRIEGGAVRIVHADHALSLQSTSALTEHFIQHRTHKSAGLSRPSALVSAWTDCCAASQLCNTEPSKRRNALRPHLEDPGSVSHEARPMQGGLPVSQH